MENIKSKVVVLTGATGGIGEAIARLLARHGAKLVLTGRKEDRLQALAGEIERDGGEAIFRTADVSSRQEIQEVAQAALQQYGRIDVLINNAGIMPNSLLNERKVDDWERMIDVNIKGVLYGIAAVLPAMREQQSGHIINVSSLMGHKVVPVTAVYSATKHAVRAITEGLRQEESAASRIRATNISPGMVATETAIGALPPEYQNVATPGSGLALSPDSVARAVAFAINEPDDAAVNEITLRPTLQEI
ncbi:SDR family oxidoreductase [Cohnella thailandensis]|uniref:SDR family oxidoreductase n=1 Tax=Cohnella thailandensis TaxID=557557 RepID=A0A841SU47_9BACL|nr:SDR family oxidoreductase [Cohnella thailandensis]MBB6633420.1 SDR family oxidoreductase [Cohnella thailandensis]MBP1977237.1 NADP-dependent 3-hydroxy acid dehydrogenase YdfG [Cohnella thailandensis]